MGEFSHLQMLETRFGCLLAKRKRHRTDVWSLFNYPVKQVRYIIGCIKFLCQRNDVAASAQSVIEPQVTVGVYLERGFRFLSERGFVPQAVPLLLYGHVAQTLQIVRDSDLFGFLDVHDFTEDLIVDVKTLI